MKRVLLLLCCLFVMVSAASAKARSLGAGVIIGEPTGITVKALKPGKVAVDGAVAWSLGKGGQLHLHGDFLFHNFSIFTFYDVGTSLYYGAGARVKLREDTVLGIRIPVGLSYMLDSPDLEIFAELVPVIDVLPGTDFAVDAGIGIRYYFR